MKKSDVLRQEFDRLKEKYGRLTPELIVRESKEQSSPLHAHIPWNDKIAAHQRRLDVARELLATYVTVVIVDKKRTVTVPMFVRDPTLPARVQGYMPTQEVMRREHAETILQNELDRIAGCINRARDIAEVLDIKHPGISAKLEFLLETTLSMRSAFAA